MSPPHLADPKEGRNHASLFFFIPLFSSTFYHPPLTIPLFGSLFSPSLHPLKMQTLFYKKTFVVQKVSKFLAYVEKI